jgi:hypothetical protein
MRKGAVETVREHHRRFASLLVRCVEDMYRLSRSPHVQLSEGATDGPMRDTDELIRLSCMNYGDDSPLRPAAALALWRSNPSLAKSSVFAVAAAGDHAAVTRFVSDDRDAARRSGGPFDWPPILYATYSRLVTSDPAHDFVETVRVLLHFGADPNSGFLWDGLWPPFTVITGAIGRGEQGSGPHVDQLTLLCVLINAGADTNDGQAIYNAGIGNAQPKDDTDWLEVLCAHSFGRQTNGPWYRGFGDRLAEPGALVAELLHDAARRGFVNRTRVLLENGADPNRPGDHPTFAGHSPMRMRWLAAIPTSRPCLPLPERDPSTWIQFRKSLVGFLPMRA